MDHAEKARALFLEGYNCAQAVVCAFDDLTGLDRETSARLASSFGGGMGRMHSDAQFAGSSSVPAHVEMMGFLGAGNNPMVGMTVAVAVAVQEAMSK